MVKDGPLVLLATAGRGSLCEQEEESCFHQWLSVEKVVLYAVSEKDKFDLLIGNFYGVSECNFCQKRSI